MPEAPEKLQHFTRELATHQQVLAGLTARAALQQADLELAGPGQLPEPQQLLHPVAAHLGHIQGLVPYRQQGQCHHH